MTLFLTSFAVSWALDCTCNIVFVCFFASDTLRVDVNACVTVKEVGGFSSNNSGRLGESEGINGNFCRFLVC